VQTHLVRADIRAQRQSWGVDAEAAAEPAAALSDSERAQITRDWCSRAPGEVPTDAEAGRYLSAAAGLAIAGRTRSVAAAYEAAMPR
jgi:hypothetical protein